MIVTWTNKLLSNSCHIENSRILDKVHIDSQLQLIQDLHKVSRNYFDKQDYKNDSSKWVQITPEFIHFSDDDNTHCEPNVYKGVRPVIRDTQIH